MSHILSPQELTMMMGRFDPDVQARMSLVSKLMHGIHINTENIHPNLLQDIASIRHIIAQYGHVDARDFPPQLMCELLRFCMPDTTPFECKIGADAVIRLTSDDEQRRLTLPFKTIHASTLVRHGCTGNSLRKLFQYLRQDGDTDQNAAHRVMAFVDAGLTSGFRDVVVDGTTVFYAIPRPEDQ